MVLGGTSIYTRPARLPGRTILKALGSIAPCIGRAISAFRVRRALLPDVYFYLGTFSSQEASTLFAFSTFFACRKELELLSTLNLARFHT